MPPEAAGACVARAGLRALPTSLALTLVTLAAGGAAFVTALNVWASWRYTIDLAFAAPPWDVEVRFNRPYPVLLLEQPIGAVPGVARVEGWGQAEASLVYQDGTDGNRFELSAVPAATRPMAYPISEGRWLQPGDENALVLGTKFSDLEPGVKVGDRVALNVGGRVTTWQVVGIVRDLATPPTVYVPLQIVQGSQGTERQDRSSVKTFSIAARWACTAAGAYCCLMFPGSPARTGRRRCRM